MSNKYMLLFFRILLTATIIGACYYLTSKLEYISEIKAVDNLVGVAPVLFLLILTGLLVSLIWKGYTNKITSTVALCVLIICFFVLFKISLTGNWYPLARTMTTNDRGIDLSVYEPFSEENELMTLEKKSEFLLTGDLPQLDGATALYPVYAAIANAVYDKGSFDAGDVICSNTPEAYERIISGDADIIFVAGPSEAQKEAAQKAGVDLVLTPIGREAFVFIVGESNPIKGMTRQQLRNIYSGKTIKWATLDWESGGNIIAFLRPEGSGSQTGLHNLMEGLPIFQPRPVPDESIVGSGSMLKQMSVEWDDIQPALGYSYRYYATTMFPNSRTKLLEIDGVYPSNEAIRDGTYPLTNDFYAVTNGQPDEMKKNLIAWILSTEGQFIIEGTGYAPLR